MRLKDFYADPKRASSEEVDFGSAWRAQGDGPWKVVWLEATGELAAVNEAPHPTPIDEIDGMLGLAKQVLEQGLSSLWRGDQGPGSADDVVCIGVERDLLRLRGALIGWEDHMPEPNGLAWLSERVDELSAGHAG